MIAESGGTPGDVAVALLHDTIEDTWVTAEYLDQAGFSSLIIHAVEAISKREGEAEESYASRVASDYMALRVKWADLADNSDPKRLAMLGEETRIRLQEKYERFADLLAIAARSD